MKPAPVKAQVGGVPGVATAMAAQRGSLKDATMSPPSPTISMKSGGVPRGCGCAKRGKTKGKMV